DLDGAIDAMRQAVEAGVPNSEATAWSEVHLGHLYFAEGDLEHAQRAYEGSTRRIDGYVYGLAGLARVQAAQGDLRGAAELYERAATTMPLPEFVIALGDVYARMGQTNLAARQYE